MQDTSFVQIPLSNITLEGDLTVPKDAKGIVIFAHGSGSSRHSPRNRFVAEVLHQYNLATLLTDLLTPDEEQIDLHTREFRFNLPMLSERLIGIAGWIKKQPQTQHLKIGYFGASTGGGASLIAAAKIPGSIATVVSRGGRVDLAGEFLSQVKAPTLLIVGERDTTVLEFNKQTLEYLNDQSMLNIIPQATHLFEEPGTLEKVAHLSAEWFRKYLI